jgi:membrane metallo-endopeptidase-like protein 1
MINEIRLAFTKNLKSLDWMDTETRTSAEEKANAITDMIGFPDFILNPDELDERYHDLLINPNEYFFNNIRVNRYNLRRNLEKLDQPVNKTTWIMTPPTVNAYYTPTKNQIVFPAGILQSPFYDMKNPSSLNFGGMGVVMGHELTHAFDDQGKFNV